MNNTYMPKRVPKKKQRPKTHWNYRVLAEEYEVGDLSGVYLEIKEVYYKDNAPIGYTPASLSGETKKGMEWTLEKMQAALRKPILWAGDKFPGRYKPGKHAVK